MTIDVASEIKSLEIQIERVQRHGDEAWENWDAEDYESACNEEIKLYAKLQELRRKL
jgi:hypothetical protein